MERSKDATSYLSFRLFPTSQRWPKVSVREEDVFPYIQSVIPKENVGILLSQGIDSLVLAAAMPKGSYAYTAVFDESVVPDESAEAARFAEKLGLKHRIVKITWQDYLQYTDELIKYRKQPLMGTEPAIYKLALEAKRDGVQTLLTGVSTEYTFGGKPYTNFIRYKDDIDTFLEKISGNRAKKWLKDPYPLRQLSKHFNNGKDIDVENFLKQDYGDGAPHGNRDAIRYAGLEPLLPYMDIECPIDLERAKTQPKYILEDLYQSIFKEKSHEKIAFNRPFALWLGDYKPTDPRFKDFDFNKLNGMQKWMVYSLERYWQLYD